MTSIRTTLADLAEPIDQFTTHPDNPRVGDVLQIAESLRNHGQYRPIVANRADMQILAGNHTFLAAKQLGWEQIAVTYVNVDDDTARKIALVDNRSGDLADYDQDQLRQVVNTVPDLDGTGYPPSLVAALNRIAEQGADSTSNLGGGGDSDGVRISVRVPPRVNAAWNERLANADSPAGLLADLLGAR